MSETLYRAYAADGTHFCEDKDHFGWIKGSTLDNETNKVHGTLDLEPVDVDLDGDKSLLPIALACFAAGICVTTIWVNRDRIKTWINDTVVKPAQNRWNKLRGKNPESEDYSDNCATDKIIDIRDYLNVDDQQENLHTAPGDHSNAQEERLSS